LLSWQTPLLAADWHVQPRFLLSETYSDNIYLAPSGDKQDDFVTQVNPGISVDGQGKRVKARINYSLQNAMYASDSSLNVTNQHLNADGSAELVKNLFFMDARSSISQQIADARGRVGLDNLNIGNQANVFTYGISPYLKLRMASFAKAELHFSDDHVENQSDSISDAETQDYNAQIKSGSRFGRMQWDANYQQRDLLRSTVGDSHYQSANADIHYNLLSSWNLLVHGGYEDNSLPNIADPHNGSYWSAGLEWAPSSRFSASATTGDRNWDANLHLQPNMRTMLQVSYRERDVGLVRGPSWNANLSHRTRHTTWSLTYSEESTTVQSLQVSGQQFFNLVDANGNLIVDPNTGQPVVLARNVFSLTDQDFIRKRGQLAVNLKTGKSDVVMSVFSERRTYSLSNSSEDVVGTAESWTWRFAPRTSGMIGVGWQRRNPANTDLHEDLWHGSFRLTHRLSPKSNASLEYAHLQNNSIAAYDNYVENRIVLQVSMRF